jgi:hypothetical protein
MEKANDPRSAILTPSYQLTFEGNDRKFPWKVFIFFLTSPLIKNIQFFDPHEDVGCVRRRFSRENWTFVNNLRSQPLKVLFLPRIKQIPKSCLYLLASWKCVLYSLVRPNSSRIADLGILINFQIYRFLREKSPFFCDGREWSFLIKTIISLNSKVMSLHLCDPEIERFSKLNGFYGLTTCGRICNENATSFTHLGIGSANDMCNPVPQPRNRHPDEPWDLSACGECGRSPTRSQWKA